MKKFIIYVLLLCSNLSTFTLGFTAAYASLYTNNLTLISSGATINFDQVAQQSNITHSTFSNPNQITIIDLAYYEINFSVGTSRTTQIALCVNGSAASGGIFGSDSHSVYGSI